MSAQWIRTHEAYGAKEALADVEQGAAWAIVWCGGGVSRSSDKQVDDQGLRYVQSHLIEPAERERLFQKAQRKRRTKTVVMAERWESTGQGLLILFYEAGPYLLPDRDDPVRV